ncbi:MAG: hypothetical protein M1834_006623 [Cirrosporium novae-zelandiae]|nr:MAG: hypothetical protein M1834_006623 [Cirrosporium novae-zelandiae]
MAHARSKSITENPKEPHLVSLKVLRLTRPSFTYQYPLPKADFPTVSPKAALSYPAGGDDQFILSPTLSLPSDFGTTYVGETFACTLCVNNEILEGDVTREVSSIRLIVEVQTPSQNITLEQLPDAEPFAGVLPSGESFQKIVRLELREEGSHVLSVSVSYTETIKAPADEKTGSSHALSGKTRVFRKLYSFNPVPCLSVRTKTSELPYVEVADPLKFGLKSRLVRYALEAQLENVGNVPVTLEKTVFNPRVPFKASSLNWDAARLDGNDIDLPILNPRNIFQIAFLIEQQEGVQEGLEELQNDLKKDGRTVLGQLNMQWRSPMGEKGQLSTGWLTTKRR